MSRHFNYFIISYCDKFINLSVVKRNFSIILKLAKLMAYYLVTSLW